MPTPHTPRKPEKTITGLNILDMTGLSPVQQAIMRIILRKVSITTDDIFREVKAQFPDDRLGKAEIESALKEMAAKTYIHCSGSGPRTIYRANLQRRSGFQSMDIAFTSSRSSLETMWQALQVLEEQETEDQAEGRPLHAAVEALNDRVSAFVKERIGVHVIIILMVMLAIINQFILSVLQVVATGGFLASLGTDYLPWLTITEMIVGVLVSGAYLGIIDALPRVRMMKILLSGLGLIYLVVTVLFIVLQPGTSHSLASDWLYGMIYLLRAQQVLVYPIVFWNLANNLYSMADAKKTFPFMVAGETLGALIGYSFFSLPQVFTGQKLFDSNNAGGLLITSVFILFLSLALVHFTLKEPDVEVIVAEKRPSLIESLREGFNMIHDVKLFRYLTLVVAFVWTTFTILWFHFNKVLLATNDYSTWLSWFNIFTMPLMLVMQLWLTRHLMERISTRNAFIILPTGLALSILPAIIFPGLWTGMAALFVTQSIYSVIDAPSFTNLRNLIPEERRGLVTALVINYAYAAGTIVGSLVLGLLIWIPDQIPGWQINDNIQTTFYMGFAILAAGAGVYCAWLVRQNYEESMLSWRLSRRSRAASVLDKLDF